jgi:hypothetical protein
MAASSALIALMRALAVLIGGVGAAVGLAEVPVVLVRHEAVAMAQTIRRTLTAIPFKGSLHLIEKNIIILCDGFVQNRRIFRESIGLNNKILSADQRIVAHGLQGNPLDEIGNSRRNRR